MKLILLTLAALLRAPRAAQQASSTLPEVPMSGKLPVCFFQPLENRGAMTFNVWN